MLAVSGMATRVYTNEMEEGDSRPDLDAFGIGNSIGKWKKLNDK